MLIIIAVALALASCSSLPKEKTSDSTVRNQASAYAQSGNGYYSQGDYVTAERFFRLALDSDFSIDYQRGIVESYNSLAKVYIAAGDSQAAESAIQGALSYASRIGDALLTARSNLVSAELELSLSNYSQAAETIQKVLAAIGTTSGSDAATAYHDLGAAYKGLEQYDNAIVNLEKARDMHSARKEIALEASDYYMIASVYSRKGDYVTAQAQALDALALDKQMENEPGIGLDLRALGIISQKSGKESAAYDYYYGSLQVFRTLGDAGQVRDLLVRLEASATKLGKTQEAATYASALHQLGASSK